MEKYKIFDITKGIFSDDIIVEAKSPLEACKKIYGKDYIIKRNVYGTGGDLVVYGRRGSYVYDKIKAVSKWKPMKLILKE